MTISVCLDGTHIYLYICMYLYRRSVKVKVDLQVKIDNTSHDDNSDKYYGADSKTSDSSNSGSAGIAYDVF